MKKKFWEKKRVIVEIIFADIFSIFILKYIGIPDKYDYYVYWILAGILVVSMYIYLKFVKKELKEILEEKNNEK